MGIASNTGPQDQPIYNNSPRTTADFQAAVDYAARVGNRLVGTTGERDAFTAKAWPGLLWGDTTLGVEFKFDGTGWSLLGESSAVPTLGNGWGPTSGSGYALRVYRFGSEVKLYGGVTAGTGASGASILTIPTAFRPATTATRPIGSGVTSTGVALEYFLVNGVLQVLSGYATGSGTSSPGVVHTFGGLSWLVN